MPERRHANARWRIALATIAGLLPLAPLASADDLPPVSARPPAWKLHKMDDDPAVGFSIYRNDLPSSDFDAYRLEALIDVPPAVVAAAAILSVAGPPADPAELAVAIGVGLARQVQLTALEGCALDAERFRRPR